MGRYRAGGGGGTPLPEESLEAAVPSRSRAEHNAMEAVAHDRKVADKLGIRQAVGREFVDADKRNKDWKKRDHATDKAAQGSDLAKAARAAGMSVDIFRTLYGRR